MSKINILIVGASGRMGQSLIQEITNDKDLALVAAIDHKSSDKLGRDAGEAIGISTGIKIDHDITKVISSADVLIDFTRPEASLEYLKLCEAHQVKYVIGTTGFSDQEKKIDSRCFKNDTYCFCAQYECGC
jgi:4-hydroxy-tetrahydrodipicolinate reductase